MKKTLLLIATMLLLAACEKQIDIDIEYTEPQVVVMSQNNAGNPVSLTLTYSRPVFGTYYIRNGEDYFQQITDATATLSVNGTSPITATRTGNTYSFAYTPQPNDQLNLSIAVPGHKAVTATATVPHTPSLTNVNFRREGTSLRYENYFDSSTVSFTLTDNNATTDYYSIRLRCIDTAVLVKRNYYDSILGYDTVYHDRYLNFECVDYLIVHNSDLGSLVGDLDPVSTSTYYGDELLFTDAEINGLSHTIKLSPFSYHYNDSYYDEDYYYEEVYYGEMTEYHAQVILEVTNLTRGLYLFRQTVDSYSYDDLLGTFTEPVQIHSNIDGGIGIFGVGILQTSTFHFDD